VRITNKKSYNKENINVVNHIDKGKKNLIMNNKQQQNSNYYYSSLNYGDKLIKMNNL
jgi:hypothetical protein